jgi:general secretion pathway protein D
MEKDLAFMTRLGKAALPTLLSLLLCACMHPSFREGMDAISSGNKESAIPSIEKAVRDEPRNPEMKTTLVRTRTEVLDGHLAEAEREHRVGRYDAAEGAYRRALATDPNSPRAAQGLDQVAIDRRHQQQMQQATQLFKKGDLLAAERVARTVRGQDPQHAGARQLEQQIDEQRSREQSSTSSNPKLKAALAKPIVLEFRDAALKSVFEVLSRSSGINFVFDREVKGDTKVTFFVRNSPLEDIVQLILRTNQLGWKQLNDNSFLIYPNTPNKAKEYQELVVRSFYLSNTDVKQAMALVKTVAKSKDVFADEKLNLLIVKDTPDAIRLIERLIDSVDLSEPEVMLEVEVLEVQRSRLRELGLDWPDAISRGILQQTLTTTTSTAAGFTTSTLPGGTLAPGYIDLGNRSGLVNFVANPALTANIKGTSGDTNVLANPRIRVKNREKAKIHIGEKLPVFTTTSTANVGVSASVSYLDVGIKLDVEPNVSLSEEVSIKVGLEVSSIVKEVPGPSGSLAYQVGTRSAATSLRLKNGETQVLAGLISDEERNTSNHIPGIGELPILKHLFGTQRDTSTKTEIMLLITPRILRNIHRPEFVDPVISTGTETAVGAPPMKVRSTGPRSLGISSQGGAITGTAARATEAPADTGSEAQAQKAAPAAENGNVVAVEAGTAGAAEPGNGTGNTATNSNSNANPTAAGEPAADASAPAGAVKAPQ